MAKAEVTIKLTIDSELMVITQEAKTLVDGKPVFENERGITFEKLSELEASHHYKLLMKYTHKEVDVNKSDPAYYPQPIPLAYFHDLLMQALKPITKDERFGC
jgi:hypothetical protein